MFYEREYLGIPKSLVVAISEIFQGCKIVSRDSEYAHMEDS